MRHYTTFQIELEAYVVHQDDMEVKMTYQHPDLRWRACVRGAKQLEWQWCATEAEALAWIESWKRKLKPTEQRPQTLCEVLTQNNP